MSNVWIANSEVVLSAALWWGRDGVERVWFGKGLEDRHFPKQHHPIYDAIRTLYADGQTITPETVLARMNGRGDIEVLRQLREQFNGWEAAGASAAVMRAEARAAWEQAALVRAVEQYRGGHDRDAIINELNQALTNSDGVEMQSTRISDINKRIISGEVSSGRPNLDPSTVARRNPERWPARRPVDRNRRAERAEKHRLRGTSPCSLPRTVTKWPSP